MIQSSSVFPELGRIEGAVEENWKSESVSEDPTELVALFLVPSGQTYKYSLENCFFAGTDKWINQ